MEPARDWRVWFDADSQQWKAQRWDGIGGIVSADVLEMHAKGIAQGRFLRFPNAEAKIGTARWIANEHVITPRLRLMPPTQRVKVAPLVVSGAMEAPG